MRVKILMCQNHPEYRLVIPVETEIENLDARLQQAISQLGDWEERSQSDLDENMPTHMEALEVISAEGAYLWMVSVDYTGRITLAPVDGTA